MKKLNSYLNSARMAGVAAIALFGVAACHSPNEFPPVPATPAGFTACTGHGNYHFDLTNSNYPLWYAFWREAADSTHATLIVGIDASNIDTIYREQDASRTWRIVENDTIVPNSLVYVYVTPDSVIEGSLANNYYLKKLN